MTRDEVIRLAEECGAYWDEEAYLLPQRYFERFFHAAYEAGAAAERENILKHAMKAHDVDGHCDIVLCADVRARGEK